MKYYKVYRYQPWLVLSKQAISSVFRLFRYWSQAKVDDDPEMLWIITDISFPLFNSVLRARLSPDSVDVAIEGAKARCASRNVPMLWWTGPTTRPTNLGKHLEAHGFTRAENAPGMAVDLLAMNEELQAPPGLVIEQVGDVEALKQWYQVFKGFFGFPDSVENDWAGLGFSHVAMFIAWQEPVLRDRGCLSVYRQELDKSDNIEGGSVEHLQALAWGLC